MDSMPATEQLAVTTTTAVRGGFKHAARAPGEGPAESPFMPLRTDRRPLPDGEELWDGAGFAPADAAPARRELSLSSQFLTAGIKKPRSRFCRRKRSSKGLSELVQKLRAVLGIPLDASLCPADNAAALSPPSQGLHLLESMLEQGPPSSDEVDAIQLLLNISCMAGTFPDSRKVGRLANHQRPKLTDETPRLRLAELPAGFQPSSSKDVKPHRLPKRKARVLTVIDEATGEVVKQEPNSGADSGGASSDHAAGSSASHAPGSSSNQHMASPQGLPLSSNTPLPPSAKAIEEALKARHDALREVQGCKPLSPPSGIAAAAAGGGLHEKQTQTSGQAPLSGSLPSIKVEAALAPTARTPWELAWSQQQQQQPQASGTMPQAAGSGEQQLLHQLAAQANGQRPTAGALLLGSGMLQQEALPFLVELENRRQQQAQAQQAQQQQQQGQSQQQGQGQLGESPAHLGSQLPTSEQQQQQQQLQQQLGAPSHFATTFSQAGPAGWISRHELPAAVGAGTTPLFAHPSRSDAWHAGAAARQSHEYASCWEPIHQPAWGQWDADALPYGRWALGALRAGGQFPTALGTPLSLAAQHAPQWPNSGCPSRTQFSVAARPPWGLRLGPKHTAMR
ncbi:hypothetical protein WJX84_000443 [Apatococcus fuscideae]|uniref:Uncharacterized protein n=1 Tax=Apatococcus fuscideae TaxID=2026836 RepID=A0AAW1SNB3_9CHLO